MVAAPINMKTKPTTTVDDQLDSQWGIQHELHGSKEQLVEAICKGIAIAISNRSFQDQQGAAAWTIEGYNKNNQILSKGTTPGSPTDQSAYRSKLFGCGEFSRPYKISAKKPKSKVDTYKLPVMVYLPYIKHNQGNQSTQQHLTMTSSGQLDNYDRCYQ